LTGGDSTPYSSRIVRHASCRVKAECWTRTSLAYKEGSNFSPKAAVAKHLENGTYLLDDAERKAYVPAARMIERVANYSLDLTQPLLDADYLLVMCAHLILEGEDRVDEMLAGVIGECLEERRRTIC
jgi:hypothetical protein